MLLKYFNRTVSKIIKNTPIRTTLIVPFTIEIVITVGLVGYFSFRNGQQAINEVATQLRREISARIEDRLQSFVALPHILNQFHANVFELGQVSVSDTPGLEKYFWKQIQYFHTISFTYFGNEKTGEVYGAKRHSDGTLQISVAESSRWNNYTTNERGDRIKLIDSTPNYRLHLRPWYQNAVATNQSCWSEIYANFATEELMITATQPIYSENDILVGVLGTDVSLAQLSEFLCHLKVGQSGKTFIMERSGLLVASSVLNLPCSKENDRLKATALNEPLIQATAHYLTQQFTDFHQIERNLQLDFEIKGQRHFVQVTRFEDGRGLDWLIVVVIPEADFMERIHANTRQTILLSLAALVLAILLGIYTSQWIVLPLVHLNRAAQNFAKGNWEQRVKMKRDDEIGELAASFNEMATQLKTSFADLMVANFQLRETENRMTQFLEAVPVGIVVHDTHGKLCYTNQRAQQLLKEWLLIPETNLYDEDQLTAVYQVYIAGTDQLYPRERQPAFAALQGLSTRVDDMEIHHPDKIVPIEAWGTPIFNEEKQIAYAIVAFQDITARRRVEEERIRFTNELSTLNKAYERFVPHQFLSLLDKKSIIDVQLGDQVEKEMTILFADIRGFTAISEKMAPQDIFDFVNVYMGQMEPIILNFNGVIDKYIGDAIMAVFPTCADDALRGAIAMLKALTQYNQILQKASLPPLKIGIGLNTGPLILGTVGGQNRMDGTVIGDAVNAASRVEGLTKTYGASLLITEETYLKLKNITKYKIRVIDRVKVKGKSIFLTVYEVFAADPPEIIELKTKTLYDFEQGFMCFHNQKFDKAQQFFENVLQVNENDQAAQVYWERCQAYIA